MPVFILAIAGLTPFLSGCDESYPAEMSYPLRTDPIVVKVPGATPWEPNRPGQLDNSIARFESQFIVDPKNLDANSRQQLDTALHQLFGTPAEPAVNPGDEEDAKNQVAELKLDGDSLQRGSKYYRRHCMHCHGVPGDGRGPTGPWVNPHPRDYRQGLFKFISTDATVNGRKPRRQDLIRTLERGIEGTSMPSFAQLGERDLELLASYVIHLSIRGEVELSTMKSLLNKEALEGDSIGEHTRMLVGVFLKQWSDSNRKVQEPTPYPYKDDDRSQLQASIRRGYQLFTDPKGTASCIACHLDFGRQVPFRYDDWGSLVRPANLTAGVYRGGRRPIDLYWRIRTGILGAQMPKADFEQRDKSIDSYWDLVNFVQALPYPQMLPEDIRERVYHSAHEKASSARAQR